MSAKEKDRTKRSNQITQVETKGLLSRIDFWEKKIKAEGTAFMHGKFHPDWFSEQPPVKGIKPLEDEPRFMDAGHINASAKDLIYTYLPGTSPSTIFQYGEMYTSKRKFSPETDQLVFITPPRSPEHAYNLKMLDGRFKTEWNIVTWGVYVKEHKDVPFRTRTNPLTLNVLLPSKVALELFQDIEKNPSMIEKLMRKLYPNIPYEVVGTKRLFAKNMSEEDLAMDYARGVQEGGQFFELQPKK